MSRFVLHQVQTDLRSQWPLLAAWLGLLVAASVAGLPHTMLLLGIGAPELPTFGWIMSALVIAQTILAMTIVARWMHADHASDSTAFWMSRPITRGDMVRGKLSSVVLLLLVPSASVHLSVALWEGLPFARLLQAAAEILVRDSLLLLPVAALSTITRDLTRVVLFAVASLVGPLLLQLSVTEQVLDVASGLSESRWELVGALALGDLVVLGVFIHQYLTRRTVRSLAALGAAGVVMVALVVLSSKAREPAAGRAHAVPRPAESGVNVSLDVSDAHDYRGRTFPQQEPIQTVLVHAQVSGIQDDTVLQSTRTDSRLTFGGGPEVKSESGAWFSATTPRWMAIVSRLTASSWRLAKPEREFQARLYDRRDRVIAFTGAKSTVDDWVSKGASLETNLEFSLTKPELGPRLPLRVGATVLVGRGRVTVLAVGTRKTQCYLQARWDTPRLLSGLANGEEETHWGLPADLVLIHPGLRQLVPGLFAGGPSATYGPMSLRSLIWPLYVVPSVIVVEFDLGAADDGTTPSVRRDWLEHGELLLVRRRSAGRFTKHVSLPFSKLGQD